MDFLMIAGGLALLFFGGEGLLKGSVSLARHFGLSNLLVSAVIVGFGTSLPELTVSVGAALKGSPEIALGNIIGSNISNILLIISAAAILYPIAVPNAAIRRDTNMMLGTTAALCVLLMVASLNFLTGLLLLTALIVYVARSYYLDKRSGGDTAAHITEDVEGTPPLLPGKAALFAGVGLVLLVAGSYLMVEGAVSIARAFGIPEAIIGLSLVAVGTSLPELATAVVAALKKHNDIVLGNILGSNIFNILGILGITAMIKPIPVTGHILTFDIWIMLAASAFLALLLWKSGTIGRKTGTLMLGLYFLYIGWMYVGI